MTTAPSATPTPTAAGRLRPVRPEGFLTASPDAPPGAPVPAGFRSPAAAVPSTASHSLYACDPCAVPLSRVRRKDHGRAVRPAFRAATSDLEQLGFLVLQQLV